VGIKQRTAVSAFWVLFVIAVFVIVALQIADVVSPLAGWALMFAIFAIGTVALGLKYPGLFGPPKK
jgi:hypothetical protein